MPSPSFTLFELVNTYVPEAGDFSPAQAVELAVERDQVAAEQLADDVGNLLHLDRAVLVAREEVLLHELGY